MGEQTQAVRLDGKVGIVTGAGRGIGAALALELARLGAAVVVNDLGTALGGGDTAAAEPADEVVAQIHASGGRAVANRASVAKMAGAESMVADAIAHFGRLDFVVHNAGIVRDVIFHKMTEEDFDAVIAVHLRGAFNLSRAAAATFRAQGGGAIVNMTSTSGLIGNVGQANYAAAKLGIVALTKAVALDMARFGVRANAVAPFAWTRMTQSIPGGGPEAEARLRRLSVLDPAQVAPLVAYLVSDAAAQVNGQTFAVRGAEVVLFSPFAAKRSLHRSGGWSVDALAAQMPSLAGDFAPLQTTGDVFGYEPLV